MAFHKATETEVSIVAPDGIPWSEKRTTITKEHTDQPTEVTVQHTRSIGDRTVMRTTVRQNNEIIQSIETTSLTAEEVKQFDIDWANGWEDAKNVDEDH